MNYTKKNVLVKFIDKINRVYNDSGHFLEVIIIQFTRAGRYTGSYRIPVFIFLTI